MNNWREVHVLPSSSNGHKLVCISLCSSPDQQLRADLVYVLAQNRPATGRQRACDILPFRACFSVHLVISVDDNDKRTSLLTNQHTTKKLLIRG